MTMMYSSSSSFPVTSQPAYSINSKPLTPGSMASDISAKCNDLFCVLQNSSGRPAQFPAVGTEDEGRFRYLVFGRRWPDAALAPALGGHPGLILKPDLFCGCRPWRKRVFDPNVQEIECGLL